MGVRKYGNADNTLVAFTHKANSQFLPSGRSGGGFPLVRRGLFLNIKKTEYAHVRHIPSI